MTSQRLLPPGSNVETLNDSHLSTPAGNSGSFLLRQRFDQFDHDPPLVTPVDEFSGLPWVMIPPDYPLPTGRPELADDNHAFHPSKSPLLSTPAGNALRNARVQRVDWYDHHIVYHGYFAGPEIPTDEADIFRRVVFAVARYIPDMALDCHGYKPQEIRITAAQKERLWRTQELRVARPGLVRGFIGNYVTRQDISHVNVSMIDEFLHSTDEFRLRFLGQWLLAQATEVATEPLDLSYRFAAKRGRIPAGLTPKTPNLVKTTLGNKYETKPYIKLLRDRLAA